MKKLLLLLIVCLTTFGYIDVRTELMGSFTGNYAGTISGIIGSTIYNEVGESVGHKPPDLTIGMGGGSLEDTRYGFVYYEDVDEAMFWRDLGGRITKRHGVGYLQIHDRFCFVAGYNVGVFWRWLELDMGLYSAAYFDRKTKVSSCYYVTLSFQKNIFG